MDSKQLYEKCPRCDGTGKADILICSVVGETFFPTTDCAGCNGVGFIEVINMRQALLDAFDEVEKGAKDIQHQIRAIYEVLQHRDLMSPETIAEHERNIELFNAKRSGILFTLRVIRICFDSYYPKTADESDGQS